MLRWIVTAVVALFALIVIQGVIGAFLPAGTPGIVVYLLSLAATAWVVRYTWRWLEQTSAGPRHAMIVGACVVGAIGFCGGFFGPMIFAPQANQGPLLGIFITGPLGFLVGAAAGYVYWRRRSNP
jgi:hypothetical protein